MNKGPVGSPKLCDLQEKVCDMRLKPDCSEGGESKRLTSTPEKAICDLPAMFCYVQFGHLVKYDDFCPGSTSL